MSDKSNGIIEQLISDLQRLLEASRVLSNQLEHLTVRVDACGTRVESTDDVFTHVEAGNFQQAVRESAFASSNLTPAEQKQLEELEMFADEYLSRYGRELVRALRMKRDG